MEMSGRKEKCIRQMDKLSRTEKFALIGAVYDHSGLWYKRMGLYHDVDAASNVWDEISEQLGITACSQWAPRRTRARVGHLFWVPEIGTPISTIVKRLAN